MEDNKKISADLIKWIALITMFIDHIGAGIIEKCYMPQLMMVDLVIRSIGRIAFPIYCFLLVEGYRYTRSKWKYELNLVIFAFISEVPFDYLFKKKLTLDYQNVYFTLLIGMLAIILAGMIEEKHWKAGILLEIVIIAALACLAEVIHTDYGWWGVGLIGILFLVRNQQRYVLCITGSAYIVGSSLLGLESDLEMFGTIAFVLIFFYNGKRKGKVNKYVFYSLYPIHIALYCGIRYLLMM